MLPSACKFEAMFFISTYWISESNTSGQVVQVVAWVVVPVYPVGSLTTFADLSLFYLRLHSFWESFDWIVPSMLLEKDSDWQRRCMYPTDIYSGLNMTSWQTTIDTTAAPPSGAPRHHSPFVPLRFHWRLSDKEKFELAPQEIYI